MNMFWTNELVHATLEVSKPADADDNSLGVLTRGERLVTAELVMGPRGAMSLPPRNASVPIARKWIRRELAGQGVEFVDAAEMLGCELVTNAIRHGSGQVGISYAVRSETLRVEVSDRGSDSEPTMRVFDSDSLNEGGWGLQLLTLYNAAWGTELTPGGNRLVWFELPIPQKQDGPGRRT